MSWEDYNYPDRLNGVRCEYVGDNIKVYEDGTIFMKGNGKVFERELPNTKSYPTIRVRRGGVNKTRTIHRVMAECFVPNPDNKPVVNHIDADIKNFKADNLEWVTSAENRMHASFVRLHLRGVVDENFSSREAESLISERVELYKRLKGEGELNWGSTEGFNRSKGGQGEMGIISVRLRPETYEKLAKLKEAYKMTWNELLKHLIDVEAKNNENRRNGKMD